MKRLSLFFILYLLPLSHLFSQQIPNGYKLLYQQNFDDPKAWSQFEMSDPEAWKLSKEDNGYALEIHKASDYTPKVRSPFNIAIISGQQFGSFILEAILQQTGKEYGHRDLCLFFGMKDPTNFYYSHIASKPDPHAHNIFIVNDEPRVAIASWTNNGIDWGRTDKWHKIRLERNIETGTIKIYFDNMKLPIMEATNTHFDYGHIGFGTFDDIGKFDNIKIWGPAEAPSKKSFFK